MAITVAAIPHTSMTKWSTFLHMGTCLRLSLRWNRGGRTKASILVARLPTNARQSSKRGIAMATAQEISTSSVRIVQIMTVWMIFQNDV